jgi:GSH-dependent disulfide-bond oxidoreductase
MIDVYTWPTPNGHKVHIMLEETGLPYRVNPVDINAGDQFKPEFLAISPNNRIPAIVDDEGPGGERISLFESGAILVYLADKTGRLLPQDAKKKYDALQWLMWQMAGFGPMLGQAHHFFNYALEKLDYPVSRYAKETRRLYGVLDRQLANREWVAAGEYTIADIAIFAWSRSHANHRIDLADYPNVKRWYEAIDARPAVQRGVQVLAERRRKGPHSPEAWKNLFGDNQFARR